MESNKHISASLIAADFMHLSDEINAVMKAGADSIHFDVMDHHYVPNLSIGPMVCDAIKKHEPDLEVDVHLMVTNPEAYILPFAKANATRLSIHPSTAKDATGCLQAIRNNGMKAGIVFNPDEAVVIDKSWLSLIDHVLLMSVNPGFGGQSFMPVVLDKLRNTKTQINEQTLDINLAVDGGINVETAALCAQAGADFFVVGSALFKNPPYDKTLGALRNAID